MQVARCVVVPVVILALLAAASPADARPRGREFPIPTAQSYPVSITAGPDGNPWFTEAIGNKVARITNQIGALSP